MTAEQAYQLTLRDAGFILPDQRPSSRLIQPEDIERDFETSLRYKEVFKKIHIDAVYETTGGLSDIPASPCIYFKKLDNPSPERFRDLQREVWYEGRTPTLWIITPTEVRIYNTFSKPRKDDDEKTRLLDILPVIADGLEKEKVEKFHRELFDTGVFWGTPKGKMIDRRERMDEVLLEDLRYTETILIETGLDVSVAHAVLGRTIFAAYLQDREIPNRQERGILNRHFFQRRYGCQSLAELLYNSKEKTYLFFTWVHETFNGDLFPVDRIEKNQVKPFHLKVLADLLSGADMSTYPSKPERNASGPQLQFLFFPYQFQYIPIELLSSVYEMFAHSRDSAAARAQSVHYTRLQLVELVLSLAMKDLKSDARVLDPACGSGVFLVEAFRRLALTKAREKKRPLVREELHELLTSQIFGIDIERGAVQVTAFSLYLALLELDPDPQPPSALKFPKLVDPDANNKRPPNLYVQDVFNDDHLFNQNEPFSGRKFNLIVSNPPWTALTKDDAPRDPDDPETGKKWGLEYCEQHQIPDRKPDQAFMLRVTDFAKPNTQIALIVASRLFYQQAGMEGETWLDHFLKRFTVQTVINLSDLVDENILFGENRIKDSDGKWKRKTVKMPASVILYRPIVPTDNSYITYISPKWYEEAKRRGEIVVLPSDINTISLKFLYENQFLWKTAFRGSQRDFRLLQRLAHLPSLEETLENIGIHKDERRGNGYNVGGGKKRKQHDASHYIGKDCIQAKTNFRYNLSSSLLEKFKHPILEGTRNESIFECPLLIAFRSLRDDRNCAAIVDIPGVNICLYSKTYYGMSFRHTSKKIAYRLNAVMNSPIVLYMAFLLSSALGWDRRLINVGDWLQIRLPNTIADLDAIEEWQQVMIGEKWLRENWDRAPKPEVHDREAKLFDEIYRLYGITKQERILVEDTIQYTIDLYRNRNQRGAKPEALKPTEVKDLSTYVSRFCRQINGILAYGSLKLMATFFETGPTSPLCIVGFVQRPINESHQEINVENLNGIEGILHRISESLRSQVADNLFVRRDLRIYDGDHFYIIKPNQKRFWSESSALNDADVVVQEHMEARNASNRIV